MSFGSACGRRRFHPGPQDILNGRVDAAAGAQSAGELCDAQPCADVAEDVVGQAEQRGGVGCGAAVWHAVARVSAVRVSTAGRPISAVVQH
eukprot:scaffold31800_cov112-Isochrysis_galbana.AAC.2